MLAIGFAASVVVVVVGRENRIPLRRRRGRRVWFSECGASVNGQECGRDSRRRRVDTTTTRQQVHSNIGTLYNVTRPTSCACVCRCVCARAHRENPMSARTTQDHKRRHTKTARNSRLSQSALDLRGVVCTTKCRRIASLFRSHHYLFRTASHVHCEHALVQKFAAYSRCCAGCGKWQMCSLTSPEFNVNK